MKLSARNILPGQVSGVAKGVVNSVVTLTLKGGTRLHATIPNGSVVALGLEPGREAFAMIKASNLIVGKGMEQVKTSARNILSGRVCKVVDGPVSAEVDIEVAPELVISATITHDSARSIGFEVGEEVSALFKASIVILGVE